MNSKIPRFKQVRTKLNLSQQEFSDYLTDKCHIKTAKATIVRYEAGIVYPSNRSLEKYANAHRELVTLLVVFCFCFFLMG